MVHSFDFNKVIQYRIYSASRRRKGMTTRGKSTTDVDNSFRDPSIVTIKAPDTQNNFDNTSGLPHCISIPSIWCIELHCLASLCFVAQVSISLSLSLGVWKEKRIQQVERSFLHVYIPNTTDVYHIIYMPTLTPWHHPNVGIYGRHGASGYWLSSVFYSL